MQLAKWSQRLPKPDLRRIFKLAVELKEIDEILQRARASCLFRCQFRDQSVQSCTALTPKKNQNRTGLGKLLQVQFGTEVWGVFIMCKSVTVSGDLC